MTREKEYLSGINAALLFASYGAFALDVVRFSTGRVTVIHSGSIHIAVNKEAFEISEFSRSN